MDDYIYYINMTWLFSHHHNGFMAISAFGNTQPYNGIKNAPVAKNPLQ